jgi:Protein of unknown function (DUF3095)
MVDGSGPAFEVGLFQTKVHQEARDDRFYQALVPFDSFDDVMRRDRYRPLPDDWIIAVTDVSHSTEAIEQGRYREVNTAGAAVSRRRQQCTARPTVSVHVRGRWRELRRTRRLFVHHQGYLGKNRRLG